MRERACNNCGGKKYEVVGQNMVKCMFCGTLYVDEQASKDEDFLLARANDLLREHQFELALDECNKIVSLFPLSFEAYFCRALATNKIVLYPNKRGSLTYPCFFGDKIVSLTEDEDFKKAISLAPQERGKFFNEIAKRTEKIKKNYDSTSSKSVFDFVLCVNGENAEKTQSFRDEILKIISKNEFSVFDVTETQDREEDLFRALETAKVFVCVVLNEDGLTQYRHIFDRYFHMIASRKKTKSSFVLCLDVKNVQMKNLPKEFSLAKNILDTYSISFLEDLELRLASEFKNSERELAKIDTINLKQETPKKKEYVDIENIKPTELGGGDVENISGSTEAKKKWIFLALKNRDFETAKGLIETELENDPYSSELLFAQLLSERKICTEEEFFSKISNFSDREKIENILRYANKPFAENFVDQWEKLIQDLDEVEFYNQDLTFLASFKTPNRENFISHAENKAVETLDEQLIENVEKCFDASEVDRFVNFYFLLAQKKDDKKYYQKILDIDIGHEESNITLMLQKFKTPQDKLYYRDREEVENMLKFLTEPSRVAFVSAVVEMVLPVAFLNLEEAQKQIEFYLSYIQDKNALAKLLTKIAGSFQQMRFFKVAEKYLSIAISKIDKAAQSDQAETEEISAATSVESKVELYWKLIQIKCHCRSDEEMVMSKVKPTEFPEWETLLELSDDPHDEVYGQIVSRNNMYSGQRQEFQPDLFDKVQLKELLQNFLARNDKILLEIEKQEGVAVKKGVDYFRLQIKPFEKYLENLDKIEDFEAYYDFVEKIKERLFSLDLSLESSVSVLEVQNRAQELSSVEIFPTESEEKFEKIAKSAQKSRFLRNFLIIFLELFPVAFETLLLIVSIFAPKQVYLYFPQMMLIVLACFSGCVGLGNLIYYSLKKQGLIPKKRVALLSLIALGFLNVVIFLLSFYLIPNTISISNESELQTLLANAQYCELSLEKDLDFDGKQWKSCDFHGKFDGNGHVLSNLGASFLHSNHGEINDLTIKSNMDVDTDRTFGMFACENYGTIKGCSVQGEISAEKCRVMGGFVGQNSGRLQLCESRLKIVILSQNEVIVGGLVGQNLSNKAENEIFECAFEGDIILTIDGNVTVGALVGEDSGNTEIFESYASANITLSNAENAVIGALVGSGNSGSHDNYALGTITTNNVSRGHVGGLYGSFSNPRASVVHSYCAVEIETELKKGLLVGDLSGTFENCFAKGEGELLGDEHPPIARTPNCEIAENYDIKFGFDESVWDLSKAMPEFLWQTKLN